MGDETRLTEVISQRGPLTDAEITELRSVAVNIGSLGDDWRVRAQFRAAVEMIAAIRQFDKASADLIQTTNTLAKWMLALTILAALFAGGSLYLSYLALVSSR